MDMESDVQGQKMNNRMDFAYAMQVLDDKDSLKILKATFDRIAMNMNTGAMNIAFDTNKPQQDSVADPRSDPSGIMSQMFYAMKGKGFELKVNPCGEVVDVSGLDELQNSMINSMSVDESTRLTMEQSFKGQFNEESMKQTFSQAFNIYPGTPVKVGDTWTKTVRTGGGAAADMNTQYKVKAIKDGEVTLDLSSNIDAGQMKGQQTGTMEVNSKSGMVKQAVLEQKYGPPIQMTMKMTITGTEK
jgi:hypothetical protein